MQASQAAQYTPEQLEFLKRKLENIQVCQSCCRGLWGLVALLLQVPALQNMFVQAPPLNQASA